MRRLFIITIIAAMAALALGSGAVRPAPAPQGGGNIAILPPGGGPNSGAIA